MGLKDGMRVGHTKHPLTWWREAAVAAAAVALVAPIAHSSGREDPGIKATANHATSSGSLMSEALLCYTFVMFTNKKMAFWSLMVTTRCAMEALTKALTKVISHGCAELSGTSRKCVFENIPRLHREPTAEGY